VLHVRQPASYSRERAYVLDVVLGELLGLAWKVTAEARSDVEITLPELADDGSLIIADRLFATPERDWLTPASLPQLPLARWSLSTTSLTPTLVTYDLPIIYGTPLEQGSFYAESDSRIELGVDIFGSIFFQLARYEEIACQVRDEHDRFPADATLAHREGFLSRPLANEYVEVLWAAMARLWPRLRRRPRVFKEYLSHDVDSPIYPAISHSATLKATLGDITRRHDRGLALARLRTLRTNQRGDRASDPYNTFDLIMDLSERRGLRSAFYFITGTTNPSFDGTYSLDDPWIGSLIRRIHERGHEVGLHPSYESFRDPATIRSERDSLLRACERLGVQQTALGGRQHFLRWENPVTWRAWEEAGLAYDSSLGFSRATGFRCGACCEYPVFDVLARRPLRLRERPLVVMEMALFDDHAKSDRDGLDTIGQLRDRCRLFAGDFTLLWHNSRLASRRERQLYTAALFGPAT
jgi:hypothetical protein